MPMKTKPIIKHIISRLLKPEVKGVNSAKITDITIRIKPIGKAIAILSFLVLFRSQLYKLDNLSKIRIKI